VADGQGKAGIGAGGGSPRHQRPAVGTAASGMVQAPASPPGKGAKAWAGLSDRRRLMPPRGQHPASGWSSPHRPGPPLLPVRGPFVRNPALMAGSPSCRMHRTADGHGARSAPVRHELRPTDAISASIFACCSAKSSSVMADGSLMLSLSACRASLCSSISGSCMPAGQRWPSVLRAERAPAPSLLARSGLIHAHERPAVRDHIGRRTLPTWLDALYLRAS
jgi:hypothetical protein